MGVRKNLLKVGACSRLAPAQGIYSTVSAARTLGDTRSGRTASGMYRPPPGVLARPVEVHVLDQSFIRSNDSLGRPPLYSPSLACRVVHIKPRYSSNGAEKMYKRSKKKFPSLCPQNREPDFESLAPRNSPRKSNPSHRDNRDRRDKWDRPMAGAPLGLCARDKCGKKMILYCEPVLCVHTPHAALMTSKKE